VLAQGQDIVPIPGTKHIRYLDENIGALEVKLTADDLKRLDEILPPGAAAGDRYHARGMETVNR
jgi:aryl-alcohol dehydrogenase-like predicted oxidoreductase